VVTEVFAERVRVLFGSAPVCHPTDEDLSAGAPACAVGTQRAETAMPFMDSPVLLDGLRFSINKCAPNRGNYMQNCGDKFWMGVEWDSPGFSGVAWWLAVVRESGSPMGIWALAGADLAGPPIPSCQLRSAASPVPRCEGPFGRLRAGTGAASSWSGRGTPERGHPPSGCALLQSSARPYCWCRSCGPAGSLHERGSTAQSPC
jgi:hypothetical protein